MPKETSRPGGDWSKNWQGDQLTKHEDVPDDRLSLDNGDRVESSREQGLYGEQYFEGASNVEVKTHRGGGDGTAARDGGRKPRTDLDGACRQKIPLTLGGLGLCTFLLTIMLASPSSTAAPAQHTTSSPSHLHFHFDFDFFTLQQDAVKAVSELDLSECQSVASRWSQVNAYWKHQSALQGISQIDKAQFATRMCNNYTSLAWAAWQPVLACAKAQGRPDDGGCQTENIQKIYLVRFIQKVSAMQEVLCEEGILQGCTYTSGSSQITLNFPAIQRDAILGTVSLDPQMCQSVFDRWSSIDAYFDKMSNSTDVLEAQAATNIHNAYTNLALEDWRPVLTCARSGNRSDPLCLEKKLLIIDLSAFLGKVDGMHNSMCEQGMLSGCRSPSAIMFRELPDVINMADGADLSDIHEKLQSLAAQAKTESRNPSNREKYIQAEENQDRNRKYAAIVGSGVGGLSAVATAVSGVGSAVTEGGTAIAVAEATCMGPQAVVCAGGAIAIMGVASIGFSIFMLEYGPVVPTEPSTVTMEPYIRFDQDLKDLDQCERSSQQDLQMLDQYPEVYNSNTEAERQQLLSDIKAGINSNLYPHLQCTIDKLGDLRIQGSLLLIADSKAFKKYQDSCGIFWCNLPKPLPTVPDNVVEFSDSMKDEMTAYKQNVQFVGECSGNILTGGCSTSLMQNHIDDLQKKFSTVYADWKSYEDALCNVNKLWKACPRGVSSVLAAMRTLRENHPAFESEEPATSSHSVANVASLVVSGMCVFALAYFMVRRRRSGWRNSEGKPEAKPLLA